MNFTREPIIETVITPREGCKLVVRSSKGASQEDYLVDAVEVVSFGHSFFFRSQERPKSFLVPVSDYEILETKETRMIIKNASADQAIKIGGGRDNRPREQEQPRDATLADSRPAPDRQQQGQGKRDRRGRRRRGRDRHHDQNQEQQQHPQQEGHAQHQGEHHGEDHHEHQQAEHHHKEHEHHHKEHEHRHKEHEHHPEREAFAQAAETNEEVKAPSFISKLFPPPSKLIKDTLSRYEPAEGEAKDQDFAPPSKEDLEDDNEE